MLLHNCKRSMALLLSFILVIPIITISPKSVRAAAAKLALANPGFEEPVADGIIPGWSSALSNHQHKENLKYEITDSRSFSGNYSFKVTDAIKGESAGMMSDPVVVTPGVMYEGKAMLMIEGSSDLATLMLRFYNASHQEVGKLERHHNGKEGFPAGQWVDVSTGGGAAPANAAYARLIAFVTSNATAVAYYDDMAVTYEETNVPAQLELTVPETVTPEQEFTVTLRAAQASSLKSAGVDVQFDPQKLQLLNTSGAGAFSGEAATVTSSVYGDYVRITAGLNETEADGETAVAELTFKAADTSGDTLLKLSKNVSLNGTDFLLQEKSYPLSIVPPEPEEPKTALANPGFEEPVASGKIPGWSSVFAETGADFFYEVTDSRNASGSYSLKITDKLNNKSVAVLSDPLDAIPGVSYMGKAKLFIEDSGTASLNLRFYDADGKQIAEDAMHFETSKGFPPNQWTDIETNEVIAPDNAKYVRLMAYTTSYSVAVAYYDDMAIAFEANDMPAVLSMVAPEALEAGQTFTVQLSATDVNQLSAVNAQLFYDKQKLRFVGVEAAGAFAGEAATVTFEGSGGKVTIDAAMNGSAAVSADTAVAAVTFEVIASSGEAWLILGKESSLNGSFHPSADKVTLMRIGGEAGTQIAGKVFGEPELLPPPIADTVGLFDGVAGKEDGRNVMYTTVKGIPPMFHVVDLDDYKLIRSIPLEGGGDAWSHKIAPDGTVYIAAGSQLWAYSPATKQAEMVYTHPGENVFWAIDIDEAGNVYIATGPSAKVLKYDPVTKQGRDYGRLLETGSQVYARSIAYSEGYVYVGTSMAKIYKVNVTTGEKTEIGAELNEAGYVYDTDVVDDKFLIVRFDTSKKRYFYDIDTGEWLDTVVENSSSGLHIAKQSLNGKIYFPAGGKIMMFDVESHAVEESGMAYSTAFRGSDWVELDDPELPGPSLVTMNFFGGIVFFNPETKTVKSNGNLLPPSASITHVFEPAQDGTIVITGMQASKASLYNVFTGETKLINMGQAGSVTPVGDKIYFGVYPKAEFFVYDTKAEPGANNPKKLFNFGDDQDRLITGVVGDGKLYIGSIPDYGKLGGAITVFDPSVADPSQSYKVFRNIVQDQSIISLAYKDGKIYGSTSINGGLSIDPTAREAKLFVWDTEKQEKIKEVSLEIPGLSSPKAIGGLTIGPDGLLWGGVNGIVFAMDPDSMKLVKYSNLFPQDGSWGQWGSYNAEWSEDGLLYMILGRRLAVIEPSTLKFTYFADSEAFTLGADGHMYYSPRENRTLMYRVTIQDKSSEANQSFILSAGELDRSAGLQATVRVRPNPAGPVHEGSEAVVFQLMDGDVPVSIVAVKQDVASEEEFTAVFPVANPEKTSYRVKVFVFDRFDSDATAPTSLSGPVELN